MPKYSNKYLYIKVLNYRSSLNSNSHVPDISIECILKATNAIEGLFRPQRIEDGFLAKKDEEVKKQLREIKKIMSD